MVAFMNQKILIKFLFVGILIFIGALSASAFLGSPTPTPITIVSAEEAKPPVANNPVIVSSPDFPSLENIGANYIGSDPEHYYKTAIQVYYNPTGDLTEDEKKSKYIETVATDFSKSQFETETQFKERLSNAIKNNPDLKPLSGYVVFTVPVEYPSYDAEKQEYRVSLLSNQTLQRSSEDEPSYTASNSFGVSTTVKKRSTTYYALEPTNDVPYDANFNTPPAIAEAIQSDIAILYIVKPEYPYVGTRSYHEKATLDKPREFNGLTYKIFGRVMGYAIYNTKTGEILSQKKLS